MKNDNVQANHRGSSPFSQNSERDFVKWSDGLKSIGQQDEGPVVVRIARRPENGNTSSAILNDRALQQQLIDESRWDDDGGSGGCGNPREVPSTNPSHPDLTAISGDR